MQFNGDRNVIRSAGHRNQDDEYEDVDTYDTYDIHGTRAEDPYLTADDANSRERQNPQDGHPTAEVANTYINLRQITFPKF